MYCNFLRTLPFQISSKVDCNNWNTEFNAIIYKSEKSNSLKKNVFLYVFHCFSPFMPKSESLLTLFALPRSLLKSNWSDFLLSLFTKERSWANPSRCSLQKSDCEQFAPVALLHKKMSDSLEKPKSKFSTLKKSNDDLSPGIYKAF